MCKNWSLKGYQNFSDCITLDYITLWRLNLSTWYVTTWWYVIIHVTKSRTVLALPITCGDGRVKVRPHVKLANIYFTLDREPYSQWLSCTLCMVLKLVCKANEPCNT